MKDSKFLTNLCKKSLYTYLSPLRDAVSCLRPYSYDNKTSQLFNPTYEI